MWIYIEREIYLAIKPHAILLEGRADSDGGGGAEMGRIKSNADAVIDG